VLKDAFDLGLDEIAQILSTSVGAVKAALHRGRGKLTEPDPDVPRTPAPGALDEFCAAFNARDLDRLTALLLDHATVEVVGASTFYGATSARGTVLTGMLFGSRRMAAPADGGRGDGMDPRFAQGALPTAPRGSSCAFIAASPCWCRGTPTTTASSSERSRSSSSPPTATGSPGSATTSTRPRSSSSSAASSPCPAGSTAPSVHAVTHEAAGAASTESGGSRRQ